MSPTRKPRARAALLAGVLLLAPLGGLAASGPATPEPIRVTVSVPPLASWVEAIGGDRVSVRVMVPSGVAPATYSPRPGDLEALSKTELYVLVGHPHFAFEDARIRPFLRAHERITVVDLFATTARDVASAAGSDAQHSEVSDALGEDPHVWLSPSVARRAAPALASALSMARPEHESELRAAALEFTRQIDALDRRIEARFEAADLGPRPAFVVVHPAWSWFARDYGLEQVAIEHEGKAPGPASLIPLIEQERARGTRVIFVQRGFPTRSAELIAGEIGAELVPVDPLARDWIANLDRVSEQLAAALGGGGRAAGVAR